MKLTPLEIRKQEFRKTLRGLDPLEVQTFLEMVAEQYEKLLEDNSRLNQEITELRASLKNYQETEKNLKEMLLNVQEVKKQSEESSRRQADLIIKEAELKALEILENARKQARQIRDEVNWLKSQKESFVNRLRHILMSQIELLSVMELDDAIPEEMRKMLKGEKRRPAVTPKASKQPPVETPEVTDAEILLDESEEPETEKEKQKKAASQDSGEKKSEDINDFFKKGIQIDDLIENIHKKGKKQ